MITFRINTDVKDDRRVVLTLPPDVPTGQAELVVTVDPRVLSEKRGAPRHSFNTWHSQGHPRSARRAVPNARRIA